MADQNKELELQNEDFKGGKINYEILSAFNTGAGDIFHQDQDSSLQRQSDQAKSQTVMLQSKTQYISWTELRQSIINLTCIELKINQF